MTRLESQIRELSPSVKDALFRRLLFAEDLAWLRDKKKTNSVIGFEVDLDGQELSGFALIAIQRHTVIAYVSDREEMPRLILFPALETLFDPGFDLLDLVVTRKEFTDASFKGTVSDHGRFGDLVKDLTPPERKVDIPDIVVQQMMKTVEQDEIEEPDTPEDTPEDVPIAAKTITAPNDEPDVPATEDASYEEDPPEAFDDEPESFDDFEEPGYDDYSEYEDEEQPKEQSRSEKLKAADLKSLNDVIDFVVMKLGVNRPLAVTLANKAMQSQVAPQFRVQLAVNIFCKLFDENKI